MQRKKADLADLAATMRHMNRRKIPSDVQGSYTGTDEMDAKPVQDADDL